MPGKRKSRRKDAFLHSGKLQDIKAQVPPLLDFMCEVEQGN